MADPTNILTVDLGDWFHAGATPQPAERWDDLPSRVESSTDRLLDLLAEREAHATFFVVGWVAWRHPQLIRRVSDAGHEIASHGFWHEPVSRHDRDTLTADLDASRRVLEDLVGQPVVGFRAPGAALALAEGWAFEVIANAGFRYDASLCPPVLRAASFGQRFLAPHLVRCDAGDLVEIPAATLGAGRLRVPANLGRQSWPLMRLAIGIANSAGRPASVRLHVCDLDRDPPALARPRVPAGATEEKLRRHLRLHRPVTARDWISRRHPAVLGHVLDLRAIARNSAPSADPERLPPAPPISIGG